MFSKKVWLLQAIGLMLLLGSGGCMGVKIGGVTIDKAFPDKDEAALVKAAARGDTKKVDALAAAGVNVNAVGHGDSAPLLWVAIANNRKGFEALLKHGANPNQEMHQNQNYFQGSTVVWWLAGAKDRTELLRLALQYGGNPDVWADTNTALMKAMEQEAWDNYYLLLEHGADINLNDGRKDIAFSATAWVHYDKLIELLERGYNKDLNRVARSVHNRVLDESSKQYPYKLKVIELLKERGVAYPPEPVIFVKPKVRLDKAERARLEQKEREGKLHPTSFGAKWLAEDRELEQEEAEEQKQSLSKEEPQKEIPVKQ